ncbi:hypothetical protein Tco_1172775 [Tanacetum coccineum]
MSKRQPGTGGSNEGTGNILGVPDESTIVSRASSEGTGSKPGVPDEEKLILEWEADVDSEHFDRDDNAGDDNEETKPDPEEIYNRAVQFLKWSSHGSCANQFRTCAFFDDSWIHQFRTRAKLSFSNIKSTTRTCHLGPVPQLMAPDHSSSGPVLHKMTSDQICSDLPPNRQETFVDNISSDLVSNKQKRQIRHLWLVPLREKLSTEEPKNIKEAMADSVWIEAIQDELHSFREDKCLNRRENQCFIVLLSGALFQPHRRRDILSFMSITKRVFKGVEIFDQREVGIILPQCSESEQGQQLAIPTVGVKIDDPNITMEEYIKLEEEKARRHGQTFNWQTATFEKVKNYKDKDDCSIDFKTEFPAIVFDNTLTTISSEPTVCPPDENEVDFRISLDESDDEDYTVIFDENSFSYKIIYVNDLKTDSRNDNNNIPSSPNPTIDYFDGLDYFKDFENEFPASIYNDGLTSKPDLEIKPLVSSARINEFYLNGETSLSEYDKENVLHFNDLFNIIHPGDLKSEKDNDDNDIDIIQTSEGNEITPGANRLSKTSHNKIIKTFRTGSFVIDLKVSKNMTSLPAVDQRHPWLRYQIKEYTEGIRHSYEQRLETIWSRPVNRVHVLDFEGLTPKMRQDLAVRLRMVYSGEGQQVMSDTGMGLDVADTLCFLLGGVRRRMTWREFILALGLHTEQEMGKAPEKVTGVDLFYLRNMDRGTTNVLHLLAHYLFRHAEGRKSGDKMSGGYFIGRLAIHFGLLGRLNICTRYGDTWAWVAQGPERQQAAAAGAHEANEAGLAAEEVASEIPAPAQAPLPPPSAPQPRTMSQRIERIKEEMHDLRHAVIGLRGVVESFTTEQSKVSTWPINCMTQLMDASGLTYQAFNSTLVGSSRMPYQRRVRPRTSDASTFAAPHTDAQPDP